MSEYVSPYNYRLPPDTFLYRKDANWYIGAAGALPADRQVYLDRMKVLVDKAKKEIDDLLNGRLSRSEIWLFSVGSIVTRLQQQDARSGLLRAKEQLDTYIEILQNALEDPTRNLSEIIQTSEDFWKTHAIVVGGWLGLSNLSLSDGMWTQIRAAASAALSAASSGAKKITEEIGKQAAKNPLGVALVAGGVVAALALYFYMKKA